jgi:hypothetical protein
LSLAVRWRYVVLFAVAGAFFWPAYRANGASHPTGDWLFFKVGAFVLTRRLPGSSESPLRLYVDNPALQIGPPPLLLVAIGQRLSSPAVATAVLAIAMALAGPAAVGLLEATARRLGDRSDYGRLALITLGGGLVVAATWGQAAGCWRHLDDVMALLAVAGAMLACARGRSAWVVGFALGVAVACKPWAIVTAPILLALSPRRRASGTLAFVAAAAVWWLPFVAAAPGTVTALGGLSLLPDAGSVLHVVGLRGDVSSWLRPVQLLVGVLAATWTARSRSWVAVPLAGLAVRVVLDPYAWSYYGMGPVLAAVACDLCLSRRRLPMCTLTTVAFLYGVPAAAPAWATGPARLAWAALVLVGVVRTSARIPVSLKPGVGAADSVKAIDHVMA